MSDTSGDDTRGTDSPGQDGVPGEPSDAELASMSREKLVELGGKMDGVETVFLDPRWPVEGTKAEKRASNQVSLWLLFGGFGPAPEGMAAWIIGMVAVIGVAMWIGART
jgi:ubiquinol-cytochrome c reductase iron-sulfur subunit